MSLLYFGVFYIPKTSKCFQDSFRLAEGRAWSTWKFMCPLENPRPMTDRCQLCPGSKISLFAPGIPQRFSFNSSFCLLLSMGAQIQAKEPAGGEWKCHSPGHTPCPLRSPPARNVTPVHLFQLHISGGPLYINRCKEILGRVLDTGQGLYAEMTVQRKCASRFALEGRSEQLKVKRKCGWAGNQVERSGKTGVFLLEPWFLKCGPAAVASPESLLEMQILGSQPRPPRVWAQRSVV